MFLQVVVSIRLASLVMNRSLAILLLPAISKFANSAFICSSSRYETNRLRKAGRLLLTVFPSGSEPMISDGIVVCFVFDERLRLERNLPWVGCNAESICVGLAIPLIC